MTGKGVGLEEPYTVTTLLYPLAVTGLSLKAMSLKCIAR